VYTKKITYEKINKGDLSFNEKRYKDYLILIYGNKCMECGWDKINPKTGKVPIQLEHIDGNSENNKLENLKLLCPNCHSLTPTYGALNKGKGRKKDIKNNMRISPSWYGITLPM
jgi:5-methylcytosine-specific restriction endonuclease McrA